MIATGINNSIKLGDGGQRHRSKYIGGAVKWGIVQGPNRRTGNGIRRSSRSVVEENRNVDINDRAARCDDVKHVDSGRGVLP